MLPTGPITRTQNDFYYHKLKSLVLSGGPSDIEPYLTPPPCPNGVYHLYLGPTGTICLHHVKRDMSTSMLYANGKWLGGTFDKSRSTYLGPHESLNSIYDTHPELFI